MARQKGRVEKERTRKNERRTKSLGYSWCLMVNFLRVSLGEGEGEGGIYRGR